MFNNSISYRRYLTPYMVQITCCIVGGSAATSFLEKMRYSFARRCCVGGSVATSLLER